MGFIDTLTTKGPIEDSRIDYFPDAVPRDCVLYLPLARNRLRGDTFRSLDSYRHPCTVVGALWTPQGRVFDGLDDRIALGQPAALDLTTLSVVAWVKSNGGDGYLFTRRTGAAFGYHFVVTGNKFVVGNATMVTSATTVNDGVWHLLGGSLTGTSGILFVDNSEIKSGAIGAMSSLATPNYIGCRGEPPAAFLRMTLGALYVFNRALTPQEIQRIYLATKDRYQ